jgi:hypothetical protein
LVAFPSPFFFTPSSFLTNARKPLKIRASFEEKNLHMVYHGLPGSFSKFVALGTFPNATRIPCNDLKSALRLVETQMVDYAVMPLDNCYPIFKNNYNL